jgi:hypothetical protein
MLEMTLLYKRVLGFYIVSTIKPTPLSFRLEPLVLFPEVERRNLILFEIGSSFITENEISPCASLSRNDIFNQNIF